MEQNKTDWQRYLESFIKEVKDFKKMSEIEFFMEYCVWTFWSKLEDIKKEYSNYISLQKENEEYLEELDYEEWLEEVYYKENEDQIYESVLSYRSNFVDFVYYESETSDYKIYELTLAYWWPNIYLTLSSRWNNAKYEFIWWWERLTENLSYMYEDIWDYLGLDIY